MTEHGGNQMKTFAAGFFGFAGVVGIGSLALLHRGASVSTAPAVVYAPVDSAAALAVPLPAGRAGLSGAPAGQAAAVESSPAPLLSDEVRDAVPAAGSAAASAGVGPERGAATTLAASRTFEAGGSEASSASEPASSASSAAKKTGKKRFSPPKLDLSKNRSAVASMVHYGVSDRAQLMGRAVGPVYNFSGKNMGGGQGVQVAAGSLDASGALQQMDAAQKQLDSSGAPITDKARLDQDLGQARQTIQASVASGQ